MRKRTWREYNKQLVQRGSFSFLLDSKIFKLLKGRCKRSSHGRPMIFCDELISLLFMIKVHYRLTYRALEGFTKDLFNFRIPTYSLICKRAKHLKLPKLSNQRHNMIILDASGIKVVGEGEWKIKIHGKSKRRKWIKIHLAIDANTQEVVAELTTVSNVGDSSVTESLLDQIPGKIKAVIADGAYDRTEARSAIHKRDAKALIPPPKNAVCQQVDEERDKAIRQIRGLGGDKEARSLWGKLTGYSRRALIESTFSRFKGIFGGKCFSKTFERQMIENRMKCLLLNHMRAT